MRCASGSETGHGVVKRGAFAGETIVADVTISPTKGDCVNTPMTEATVKGSMGF